MSRPKISLIGGGQVGGNIALLSAQKELGDIEDGSKSGGAFNGHGGL